MLAVCPRCYARVDVTIQGNEAVFSSHSDERGRECDGPTRQDLGVEILDAEGSTTRANDSGNLGGGISDW